MSDASARVADSTGNWVDTLAPQWARPYLRLSRFDRPIGSWLLLMPCWWSAALASGMAHDVHRLPLVIVLFFIGAFVMRGAGCTWNDITDRDLDDKVERTRSRPLPSGQVTTKQALAFMVAQALIGLVVLLQFNRFAVLTGIASLLIVAIYPFMKRILMVAADRAQAGFLLGRPDGIRRHLRAHRRHRTGALCRRDFLGDRL